MRKRIDGLLRLQVGSPARLADARDVALAGSAHLLGASILPSDQ